MSTTSNAPPSLATSLVEKAAVEAATEPRHPLETPEDRAVIRHLTFWRDGFTFGNDNVFRSYDDPANLAILTAIQAGSVPPSVVDVLPGQLVNVRVANNTSVYYSLNAPLLIDDSDPSSNSEGPRVANNSATVEVPSTSTPSPAARPVPGQPNMAERQGSFSGAVSAKR
ncbi:hypothetical protein B0H16DRAFT_1573068 [Mycena metata]|uniref:SEP domain-containing protein n=1 Tax=Mycena metata TaxID=1033252 RepID=A0AAD7I865_9AGAR|nr:hypothetical protein B0H16DRAFT_1573068 [Mycena metata]